MADKDKKNKGSENSDATLLMCALLMAGVKNEAPDPIENLTKISEAKSLDEAVLKAYKNVLKVDKEKVNG